MARYIDADALTDYMLERYNDLCDKHGDYDHYTTGYGDAIDAVDNAPTAEVVPKSEVIEDFANRLKEKLYTVPTVYNAHFRKMVDAIVTEMKGVGE